MKILSSLGQGKGVYMSRRTILGLGLVALVELAVAGMTGDPESVTFSQTSKRPEAEPTPGPDGPIHISQNGSTFVSIHRGEETAVDGVEPSWLCQILQRQRDKADIKVDSLERGCEYRIEITDYDVIIPQLSPELDGIRVVQLTDIHIGRYITPEDTKKMADIAGSLEPDLVLLTGDYAFHPEVEELNAGLEPFSTIPAPRGTYASLGNHDYWDGEQVIRDALERVGIELLVNTNREIAPGLWLAVLDDLLAGKPDLDSTFEGIPEGAATVLVSHSPKVLPSVTDRSLVVLAGHTHGGQIRLPWQNSLSKDDPNFYAHLMTAYEMTGYLIYRGNKEGVGVWRYMEGWFQEGHAWMYVSRGLGVTRPPIRYDCPAEITLFRLRSSP